MRETESCNTMRQKLSVTLILGKELSESLLSPAMFYLCAFKGFLSNLS